jgi:hypothetical protein
MKGYKARQEQQGNRVRIGANKQNEVQTVQKGIYKRSKELSYKSDSNIPPNTWKARNSLYMRNRPPPTLTGGKTVSAPPTP